MDKATVVDGFREKIREQFALLKGASDAAREDATDEESRARSKYETQGLETSYLAAGQAARAEELSEVAIAFNNAPFPPFPSDAVIAEGALVQVDFAGDDDWFLLAPTAGGLSIEIDGSEITVLSPETPLRKELQGLRVGDTLPQRRLTVRGVS